jgi:hypothetical protein
MVTRSGQGCHSHSSTMTVISSWITCLSFIAFGVYFLYTTDEQRRASTSQVERDEEDSPRDGDWGG